MEQIEEQLTSEIRALQEHIRRVGDQALATSWTADLLDPLERVEEHLSPTDLKKAVTALYYAQNRFSVNGHLTERIQEILDRHGDLIEAEDLDAAASGVQETPYFAARDPDAPQSASDASSFEDADEEPYAVMAADADDLFGGSSSDATFEAGVFPATEAVTDSSEPMPDSAPVQAPDADNDLDPAEASTPVGDELFNQGQEIADEGILTSTEQFEDNGNSPAFEAGDGESVGDELFNQPTTGDAATSLPAATQEGDSSAHQLQAREEKASKIRGPKARKAAAGAETVDIFSAKVSLNELQASMGFSLPEPDVENLENRLRAKLEDQVISTLQTHKQCKQQFLLIPRVSRFYREGTMYPCTIKNLAKIYIGLFADIKDVAQYRSCSFMSHETPEPGWAVVLPEAPRESLDKSYMEHNQYLRYLASTLKLSSHLVRRRTLTEALYDLIVGRMVLGQTFQKATLDWTSTGASKTDFVCIYYSDAGIRLRHLSRQTRNKALGLCPNW